MFGFNFVRQLRTIMIVELSKRGSSLIHSKLAPVVGLTSVLKPINNITMSERFYSTEPLKPDPADNIVWVDLEMTGLDPEVDHVLEVACLVTDSKLNIVAEGPDLVINHPKEVLENMNQWSIKQHGESGLTEHCHKSTVTLKDAEMQLLQFVRQHTPFKKCPLGGNTIYMDRIFLMKHMPEFEQHMHYRIIDVSSVKELCRRWYPEIYVQQPNKKELSRHRALYDIKDTIKELAFYRDKIFRKPEGEAMSPPSWC